MLLFVTFQDAVAVGEVATTFVPPPRTIHDITAILQQQTQGETQARARARSRGPAPTRHDGRDGAL
jgi:hypothetical protein